MQQRPQAHTRNKALTSKMTTTLFERILIVDDNTDVLLSLELLLKQHAGQVVTESNPNRLPQHLAVEAYDVILLDMNFTRDTTTGSEGFHWLDTVLGLDPEAAVVLITGYGDVEMAVKAIKHGATDFVLKPWDNDKLVETLRLASQKKPRSSAANVASRLQQQLTYARRVQERLFPQFLPRMQTLNYSGTCRTAHDTGGDYYDFLEIGPRQLGLALGDVSGKGVSAALLMASLQGRLQSAAPMMGSAVDKLATQLNRSLCQSTEENRFITFFYGLYDDTDRSLTYVNAGHNPPLLVGGNGSDEVRQLEAGGAVLGIFPDSFYQSERMTLSVGDLLVLYTDGITEALNPLGQEYGEERLLAVIRERRDLDAAQLQNSIVDSVAEFAGQTPQHDDMTLVVAQVK